MHKAASKIMFDDAVANLTPRLLKVRDWQINSCEFPVLDITYGANNPSTALRVKYSFDEWDDQPPKMLLCSVDGEPLKSIKKDPKGVINDSAHNETGLPFVCSVGSREYHTHSSHLADSWSNYRGKPGYGIGDLITKLWQAWKKSIQ